MSEPIAWPQLIVLMVHGDGTADSLAGEIRARGLEPLGEDDEPEPGDEVIDDGRGGRAVRRDYGYRIWRRGELARREGLDGRVHFVDGTRYRWVRYAGEEDLTAFPRERHSFASSIGGLDVGGPRPTMSRWDGTDFTRPTGPARRVAFLGRPAWEIELAPPSHKPYPIQLIVDAGTGLVLREGNAGFGTFAEWVSLEVGVDLPDELFVWNGPAQDSADREAAREAEHERDMANRRAWLAVRDVALPLDLRPELMLNDWHDDTGAFHATFMLDAHGSLVRRPHSGQPWPEVESQRWPRNYRWSDARWDWYLGSDVALDDGQVAALRARLANSD